MTNYGFLIDQSKCIGCHACSTACKSENQVPLGVNRTWVKYVETGAYPDVRRRFQVTRCNHCANPPCVRICPVTAMYQRGIWLYQKFHSLADARALAQRYIGPEFEIIDHDGPLKSEIKASSWAAVGTKAVEPPREEILNSLKFEFNLPLPEGKRFGRGADICEAWECSTS